MTRTTKTLLAVGGIIVLGYPGIAWLTGIAIESRIQQSEQRALDETPYLTLVKREYHRGVYRSTEIATYALHDPLPASLGAAAAAALPSGATITVVSRIEHGPLPGMRAVALATVDSTVSAPPAVQKALSSVLGSRPLLEIHTTVGLFGGTTAHVASPAFSLTLSDGSRLDWGGLAGAVTTTPDQSHWAGRFTASRLAVVSSIGGVELTGIRYSGSGDGAFNDLYLGHGTFTLASMHGSGPGAGYSLRQVSITSDSKADGSFIDTRIDAAVTAARFATVRLSNLVYSESFDHLYGPSFASMMQALRNAGRQAAGDPARLQAGMQDALRRYGVEILVRDPVLVIHKVSFSMPEGSFLFSARLSSPGLTRAQLQWPAAIAALKEHGEVAADLRVGNGLVQKLLRAASSDPKLAAQLASFERQGYLTAGSGAVTTHLTYQAGRLSLNGHPFPPAPPTPAAPPAR